MESRKIAALTATLAGITICGISLIFSPVVLVTLIIKNKNARMWAGIALLIISTICLMVLVVGHSMHDGLGQALKSTNVDMGINEDGEEFIRSLPLMIFEAGLTVFAGSIAWIGFFGNTDIFSPTLVSPRKALLTIDKFNLMKDYDSCRALHLRDVQSLTNYTDREMLALAEPFQHPDQCAPSTAVIYIIGLGPALVGAYFMPIIIGNPPSLYWMDHLGGYFADAASFMVKLVSRQHYNLRSTIWSLPVLFFYCSLLVTPMFRYAHLGYNALLTSLIEERHLAAKQREESTRTPDLI